MTYQEIVEIMKNAFEPADASAIVEHAAIQINVFGEGEGAFYIEVSGGRVNVQPYEYYDRDAIVTTNADTLVEIAEGRLKIDDAFSANRLWIDGNVAKVFVLNQLSVVTNKNEETKAEEEQAAEEPVDKKSAEDGKKIESYRMGIVMSNCLQHWNCCVPRTGDEEHFRYIDVIYSDGSHKFIYDDDKGYSRFLENFHKNRFTSFHEFFTTEELAIEQRGALGLKYYVLRGDDDYIKMSIVEGLEKLSAYKQLPDRITVLSEYDRTVNYHFENMDN